MINNLSNKAFAWIMAFLFLLIIATVLLWRAWNELESVGRYAVYGLAGLAGLAALYACYRLYDDIHNREIKRRQIKAAPDHEQRIALHELRYRENIETERQRTEQLRIEREQEREQARLEMEHEREQLRMRMEHEREIRRLQIEARRLILAEGQVAVFEEERERATIHAPRVAQQLAQSTQNPQHKTKPGMLAAPRQLPEAYDLYDVFKGRTPDGKIFLGYADGGEALWVDGVKALCHGVFNAATGRGKTIIERGIETQLLANGYEVLHLDLKFSLQDETGLDYRPIAHHLLQQGSIDIGKRVVPHLVTEVDEIADTLEWLANDEMQRRMRMFRVGNHTYSTLYCFLEELLFLMSKRPEIAEWIGDIIVVGRSLGVKLFTAAQNFQAQNTNLNGGMREQFETAYYSGGDDISGAKMLDVSQKALNEFLMQHNIVLGKGITMLRNNAVCEMARLNRVGMSSNNFVYHMLGRADNFSFGDLRGPSGTKSTGSFTSYRGQAQNRATMVDEMPDLPIAIRQTGPIAALPKTALNEPGAVTGTIEQSSPVSGPKLGPDDRRFSREQEQEFLTRYDKRPRAVKEILREMNGGQGLTNRYAKHASWLVEQYRKGSN